MEKEDISKMNKYDRNILNLFNYYNREMEDTFSIKEEKNTKKEENENQNVTPINVFNYVYYYPVYYSLMNYIRIGTGGIKQLIN